MGYGRAAFHRFNENKRAVEDKYMGPLVKTIMTRCIQCTRCVRFATEVAGVPDLGATGRGEDMEITTYLEKAFASELSGNVVDLCPVGALTSKPYAFNARPWELRKTESIDVMDAQGCNIRVDTRGPQVMRVLPRLNEEVNEEWISDKARHACDGLARQRLDRPYIRGERQAEAGELGARPSPPSPRKVQATDAGQDGRDRRRSRRGRRDQGAEGSDDGAGRAAISIAARTARRSAAVRARPICSTPPSPGVEAADAILLVGANPRWEAPVLNARIRKTWLAGGVKVANIGPAVDLTYPVEQLGTDIAALEAIANGSHAFAKVLNDAKRPMIILGAGALTRTDGAAILKLAAKIAADTGMIGPAGTACRRRLERLQHPAHRRHPRRGARSRLSAGRGRPRRRRHRRRRAEGRDRLHLSARRRRIRRRPSGPRLRRLSGQPWRCRRPSCRCDPAGRRLYREGRPLRQFRRPGAARRTRRLPAGRGQGRLGDPARAVRCAGRASCLTTISPRCARRSSSRTHRISPNWATAPVHADTVGRDLERGRRSRPAGHRTPLGARHRRLLPDQPDRARQRDHGQVQPGIRAPARSKMAAE